LTDKKFSEVFFDCLPPGSFDPIIKELRRNRKENRLTIELEQPPPHGWSAEAKRRVLDKTDLSDVVFIAEETKPPAPVKVFFGKPSRTAVTEIGSLPHKGRPVCICGRIFEVGETREGRARVDKHWREAVVYKFSVTDGSGSVCVHCTFEKGNAPNGLLKRLNERCKNKEFVFVYGVPEPFTFKEKEDWIIAANCIQPAETPKREDRAEHKRVELHLHTKMSDKDATTPVAEAVAVAARWGHSAVAVTDHGVCHAFPEAMYAGKKHGVKILYGCEGYLALPGNHDRAHIILIAKTQDGLRNLYKLISAAHIEHFKSRPRLPKELLEKHREGLIAGAACERGEVFAAVRKGAAWDDLLRIASFYDYLEIQPLCNNRFLIGRGEAKDDEDLREWNRTVVKLGKALGKPVCATGDVHFLDPEDEVYRAILLNSMNMLDGNPLPLYFKTTDEMLEEFSYLGEEAAFDVVVTGPQTVAGWVGDVTPIRKGEYFPRIEGSAENLQALVYERARALYGDPLPPIIEERLEKELSSIIKKGYDTVYTVSQKLVQRSMDHGYLVGSRGSVGSSIAAFFAGITEVNALPPHYRCPNCKHADFPAETECGIDLPDQNCPVCGTALDKDGFDIPFATFLGFDADKIPDIDLNFSSDYHERAGAHVTELFGESNVFRSGTIATIGEKTAMGFALKYIETQNIQTSDAELKRLAKGLEGVKTTTGQHPGGMIIVPQGYEIVDFCPVHRAANKKDGTVCTHFDYDAIEENLLKLDILGHDCPTFIRRYEELTGEKGQDIPLDDPVTMSLFSSSHALGFEDDDLLGPVGTAGIPEYGTRNVRGMLQKTTPKTFDELVRISVLSHGEKVWHGNAEKLIGEGIATLREVICSRDDIMLFLISKGIPGKQSFAISECVRKKGPKPTPEMEETMRGAGVPEWYIRSCRDIEYLFPKAHAAAYAIMSARVAWMKAHRPEVFYSAYFTIKIDDFSLETACMDAKAIKLAVRRTEADKSASKTDEDKAVVLEIVYEMLLRGITFDPLDIRTADALRFAPSGNGRISVPFMAVAGVGKTAALSIVREREKAPFLAEDDLLSRCRSVTKAHVASLRAAGALGEMPETAQITLFDG
jgi:DNA polymerase-3 subunit alpha (Gram-positive type)